MGTVVGTKAIEKLPVVGKEPSKPKIAVRAYKGSACGGIVVPNKTITQLGTPPEQYESDADFPAWVAKKSATPSVELVDLTVQGNSGTAVVIDKIEVEIVKRRPAPSGVVVGLPCGEPFTINFARINLDRQPVRVDPSLPKPEEMVNGVVPDRQYAKVKFPYQVTAGKADQFALLATTSRCSCEWVLKVKWSSDGAVGESIIKDNGKPFLTTSPARMQRYTFYSGGSWEAFPITNAG
ncbi:hypothetical protein E1200_21985 [Actinomadura sp. GC306]|uniref:hypothetical protein n=1 Tax=Actinomadura sp. GC306 TaxID=2530367 RepID=UPI001046F5E8|nr:hypothetical protein [Actinomadura sp. GC306]TDC63552.1 hypothetical protein E1200_21985 [Actinomadura sp. GC306]